MKLTAIFEPAAEGGFTCWIEELPEVISEGDTMEEARANLRDALELVLAYRREEAQAQRTPQAVEEVFTAA